MSLQNANQKLIKALKIVLGILLYFVGVLFLLAVFFAKSNIFKHIINLIKGPQLDYGWQQYSGTVTGIILNLLMLLVTYFAFKKGSKLTKTKN